MGWWWNSRERYNLLNSITVKNCYPFWIRAWTANILSCSPHSWLVAAKPALAQFSCRLFQMTAPICTGYTTNRGWRCSTLPTHPFMCLVWVSSKETNTRFPLLLWNHSILLQVAAVTISELAPLTLSSSASLFLNSCSNGWLLKAFWNFKTVCIWKVPYEPVDKLETTPNWLKKVNQNRLHQKDFPVLCCAGLNG